MRKKGTPAAEVKTLDVASQVLLDKGAFATTIEDQKSVAPADDKNVVKFNIINGCAGCNICSSIKRKN